MYLADTADIVVWDIPPPCGYRVPLADFDLHLVGNDGANMNRRIQKDSVARGSLFEMNFTDSCTRVDGECLLQNPRHVGTELKNSRVLSSRGEAATAYQRMQCNLDHLKSNLTPLSLNLYISFVLSSF